MRRLLWWTECFVEQGRNNNYFKSKLPCIPKLVASKSVHTLRGNQRILHLQNIKKDFPSSPHQLHYIFCGKKKPKQNKNRWIIFKGKYRKYFSCTVIASVAVQLLLAGVNQQPRRNKTSTKRRPLRLTKSLLAPSRIQLWTRWTSSTKTDLSDFIPLPFEIHLQLQRPSATKGSKAFKEQSLQRHRPLYLLVLFEADIIPKYVFHLPSALRVPPKQCWLPPIRMTKVITPWTSLTFNAF